MWTWSKGASTCRNLHRLGLSLTTRTSAMATKFLASKATVGHRMYKISPGFTVLTGFCLEEIHGYWELLISFWECESVWKLRGNQIQKCNLYSLYKQLQCFPAVIWPWLLVVCPVFGWCSTLFTGRNKGFAAYYTVCHLQGAEHHQYRHYMN